MKLKDILDYFEIDVSLPDYLYSEEFNDVFLNGNLTKEDNTYKIVIETRKDVIHTICIDPFDDYPVTVISTLPNGKTNGTQFGKAEGDLNFI
jgi:hypothetical protein